MLRNKIFGLVLFGFIFGFVKLQAEPIMMIALPKSGSNYLFLNLCNQYKGGMQAYQRVSYSAFPTETIHYGQLLGIVKFDGITGGHMSASKKNIDILQKICPKAIVHFRDVRQATLSWLHHLERRPAWIEELKLPVPINYRQMSLEEKLDWQIDNYLPSCVRWIQEWLEVEKNKDIDILIMTYEEMVSNPLQFFLKIHQFYKSNLQLSSKDILPPESSKNYRNGTADEWFDVFTLEQKERATALIPEDWFERFHWIR